MNLLLATLATPLATAGIGAFPGPRRPKEAVFLGGLATTFVLSEAPAAGAADPRTGQAGPQRPAAADRR